MKRPLVHAALAFAGGAAAGEAGWIVHGAVLAVPLLAGAALLLAPRGWRVSAAAIVLLFGGAGASLWQARHGGPAGDALLTYGIDHPDSYVTLSGRVRAAPVVLSDDDYAAFVVDVETLRRGPDWLPVRGRTQVSWSNPAPGIRSGDQVRFSGILLSRLGPVNHGITDAEDYLRRQGIHTRVRVRGDAVHVLGTARWRPSYWASCLRQWQADALHAAAPASILPFLRAVWLGDRGAVEESTKRALRDSGTAHILTVSGVHVGIVALCIGFVLPVVVRSRKARALLTMVGVLVFTMASGLRPSSLRAAAMICTYLSADLFGRERDAPTALAIAALFLLALRPALVGHAGFILSFCCVASILLFAPPMRERLNWLPRWSQGAVAASFGVSVLAWPLSAAFFNVLPLLGPLTNVLVVPLITAVLWLCLASTVCSGLLPAAAPLFGHAIQPFVALIEGLAKLTAAIPFGHFNVPPPTWIAIVFWGLFAAALYKALHVRYRPRRWFATAGTALLLALVTWGMAPTPAAVHFLDVGQSDAAFVRTPAGATVMVDAGDASMYTDMGERVVAPFLRAHGVRRIDYAFVSHPDRDHLGGYFHLLDAFPVGTLVLPPSHGGSRLEDALLAQCEARGVAVRRVAQGEVLDIRGASVEVLHPPANWGEHLKTNERSLVLRLRWPGMSVLFAGDIEQAGEAETITTDCGADILKVPHHGSQTSSSSTFIEAVAPRFAVCSTTRAPAYVLRRYRDRGIAVLRTDHLGGIRVTVEKGTLVFQGARHAKCYSLGPAGSTTAPDEP